MESYWALSISGELKVCVVMLSHMHDYLFHGLTCMLCCVAIPGWVYKLLVIWLGDLITSLSFPPLLSCPTPDYLF